MISMLVVMREARIMLRRLSGNLWISWHWFGQIRKWIYEVQCRTIGYVRRLARWFRPLENGSMVEEYWNTLNVMRVVYWINHWSLESIRSAFGSFGQRLHIKVVSWIWVSMWAPLDSLRIYMSLFIWWDHLLKL